MTELNTSAPTEEIPRADQPGQTVAVWDLPLRFFHWSMVIVGVTAAVTGFLAPTWWLDIHILSGYAISILLLFRIIWGLMGSHYSRYKNFILYPPKVIAHIRNLIDRSAGPSLGHNPVGAWVIVGLMFSLSLMVLSGLIGLGGQEKLGPFAFILSFETGVRALSVHEFFSWALLFLVLTHFMGVVVEQRVFKHPVISAMVTGDVPVGDYQAAGNQAAPVTKKHTTIGAAIFVLVSTSAILIGISLSNKPAFGYTQIALPETYASECGDCHDAYHPSLRTSAAWKNILGTLEDHFGEDASLDDATIQEIAHFTSQQGAENFDTEVSHLVGRVDTESRRMTDTAFWKKRHQDIDDTIFAQSSVGSKVNCNACHSDAPIGRFDDSNIHIPQGNLP